MRAQTKKILPVPVYTFFSRNRMAIAFSVALVTLAVSGLFAFRIVLHLKDDYNTVSQKYDMLKELDQVLAQVSLGQSELRSFYLTTDSTYLAAYRVKQDSINRHFSLLRNPLNIREEQLAHIHTLDSLLEARDTFNEKKIGYFSIWGMQSAEQEYSVKKSQEIMRRIEHRIHTFAAEEKIQLMLRKSETTTQAYRALIVIAFGGFVGILLFVIVFLFLNAEIRQRSNAEQQIRDSEKRFLSFLEAIPAGVFILTPDGKPYYANEEAKAILGDGILPKPGSGEQFEMYDAYIQGTDTVYPLEHIPIMRALKGERSTISDIEVWKPDAIVPLIVTGTPIYDPGGALQYAVAVFVDISDQKKAEQGLADSEERFRQIIENASDIIYRTDNRGNFIYVNPTGLKMLGYDITEVLGMHFTLFVKPEEQSKVAKRYFRQMLTKTKSSYAEFPAMKRNGEEVILGQSVELLYEKNTVVGFLAIARNITERKMVEEEISRRQQQLDTVVMTVDEGITLSDESGRFEIFNSKMEELTGYSKEEANRGEFTELLYPDPDEQKKGIDRLGEVVEKGFVQDVETSIVTKSGEEKTLLISTRIVHVKDKVMYLSAYRDITSRKRFEEELKKAKESAESATIAKSQFLATMSHEIRTPMNGVIGMTDLLMQSELNPEQREYTEIIRTSGETLLTLINDILDFSKIESGKLDMEKRPIDLQNLIEETFDLLARRAVEKRLDLVYLIDPSAPQFIIGDPVRMRQILLNLTNNAIKFTEKGEVFLTVKEIDFDDTFTTLQFSVKDSGIGIPKEKAEKLFKAFSQVDASTTRKYGGTGLGLAITKRLVELMDGTVWVDSEEGKGSTFHFTIKVPTTTAADAQPRKYIRGKIPELQGKRVLLVDDNQTNLNILSIQCSNWGMHPRATTSQQEALQWLIANDPFDAAIIDYHMPEMNGVDLARAIRTLRDQMILPIVLFSSSGRSEFSETENALFAAVILKPMKQSHLYSTMIDVLTKSATVEVVRIEPSSKQFEPISEQFPLKILVAEDNLINQKLALRLLRQLGYRADIAVNGKEAVAMAKKNAYDIIFMDIHMPEIDGLQATRLIVSSLNPAARPKIIAMTADAMSGDREKCFDAGMDDYISKPVRLEGLQAMLLHYGTVVLEQKSDHHHKASNSAMYIRLKELLEQTDKDFMTEFVQSYPSQSEMVMRHLRGSRMANDIPQGIFAAHKLRGLAMSFGAEELAEMCKVIELNAEATPVIFSDAAVKEIEASLRRSYEHLTSVTRKLGIA